MLRNSKEDDENIVRKMCSSCKILTFYEKSCDLAEIWFRGEAYSEDAELFKTYCLEDGVFDFGENTGAAKGRNRASVGYLGRRLFVGRDILEGEFPELKGRPYLNVIKLSMCLSNNVFTE